MSERMWPGGSTYEEWKHYWTSEAWEQDEKQIGFKTEAIVREDIIPAIAEIDRLRAAIKHAAKTLEGQKKQLERYPKTADGKFIYPGMFVWGKNGKQQVVLIKEDGLGLCRCESPGRGIYSTGDPGAVFSKRQEVSDEQ